MQPGPETTVLIADDHPLFRDGLARHICERDELRLVGEAADGAAALDAIRDLRPDVAVVDLKMPRVDGIRVAAAAAREAPCTRVMILSAYIESALVFRALAAGAQAFLSKDAGRGEVCDAIVAVARGEVVLPPGLHSGLVEEIRARAGDEVPALTARELEVLQLVAAGASAPEIGERLHLSTGTIKSHLSHLYDKLGVSDRAAAVAEGMRRGLVR
ncbi:MAG TPA: response regulator transcription factor [Solirubrobacteraceae bacterium]|nr:response regulator transcription factor [Solirubrobacteraceae bacterium]